MRTITYRTFHTKATHYVFNEAQVETIMQQAKKGTHVRRALAEFVADVNPEPTEITEDWTGDEVDYQEGADD